MSDFLKADIFFFVTTIAVVFVSIAVGIAAYYVAKAAHAARTLTKHLEDDLAFVRGEAASVRKAILTPFRFVQHFIRFLFEDRYY